MTIVFSVLSKQLLVMTVDSAVTLDFSDHREYEEGEKAFSYPGVGCVATWGARDGNCIAQFLRRQNIAPHNHSVEDLAQLVDRYLTEDYKPHEFSPGDVGYHVAGFDRTGYARLYHVFWGFDLPTPPGQTSPKYEKYDHSFPSGIRFLFNGRNDLAETLVRTLIDQIDEGNDVRFNLKTHVGLAQFSEFVARFAAELTPEVGPPFFTYLISPQNKIERVTNNTFCPTRRDVFLEKLKLLGL